LGTSYPSVVERLARLVVAITAEGTIRLAVDATGVGRPVVDMLRPVVKNLVAVTIMAGSAVNQGRRGEVRVPKTDLIGGVQAALGQQRLRIAAALPETDALVHELLNFRSSQGSSDHETLSAGAGAHDDLVLALALGLWQERRARRVRILV
jgi:hypothetical protein